MKNSEKNNLPFVSVVIACRNEENFIGRCLDSINANDYPKDKLEVLVIDGMSDDGTRKVVQEYNEKFPFIKLLDNPEKVTPVAMNIGIKGAGGGVIILVNAHCVVDSNFLKYSIECLLETGADAVGGTLNTINDDTSLVAQAIPLAADSMLGAGGNRYRTRTDEGWVRDTLPYCAYRREIFDKIGLIDEDLVRGQDAEFNYRILRSGGRIYYAPKIKSYLHIRPTLKKLWRQHFQYGWFKPLITKKTGFVLTCRQSIPAIFVSSLVCSLVAMLFFKPFLWVFLIVAGSYALANLVFSLKISFSNGLKCFFVLPLVFVTLHFSYGIGYLTGIWDLIIVKKDKKRGIKDIPLTR